jgi:hypothetical protein
MSFQVQGNQRISKKDMPIFPDESLSNLSAKELRNRDFLLNNPHYFHSKYKTELCKKWQSKGKCSYKRYCLFAHGVEELINRKNPPKYKTKICANYGTKQGCPYGLKCQFVHEKNQYRLPYNLRLHYFSLNFQPEVIGDAHTYAPIEKARLKEMERIEKELEFEGRPSREDSTADSTPLRTTPSEYQAIYC